MRRRRRLRRLLWNGGISYSDTRDLYLSPGVREPVNFRHIKGHYCTSQPAVNPTRIVPSGPLLYFDAPHCRWHRS